MESLGFGIGMLLALFGPLLLIPITWGVYRVIVRPLVIPNLNLRPGRANRILAGTAIAAAIVAIALAVSYFPGRWEFDQLCAEHSEPWITKRVRVHGFYRTRLFAYEVRPFLEDRSFEFLEGPHPYRRGTMVRYTMENDGEIREEEVPTLRSRYAVRDEVAEKQFGILWHEKVIYDMASSRELARATSLTYDGGRLSLLLGAYVVASCPDVRTEEGAERFRTYYNLEKIVLGGRASD